MKKLILLAILIITAITLTACGSDGDAYIPKTKVGPEIHNLAQCLTDSDAVMYGTEWCPHCKDQKELFGEAFSSITYVDCEKNPSACNAAGVQGFPTWVINGQRYSGTQQLYTLSKNSGCPLAAE